MPNLILTLRPQNAGSRALFYLISIMLLIFTKYSVILWLIGNVKTNNNFVSYHLVSSRVISISTEVTLCIDAPKEASYYSQNIMLQFYIVKTILLH